MIYYNPTALMCTTGKLESKCINDRIEVFLFQGLEGTIYMYTTFGYRCFTQFLCQKIHTYLESFPELFPDAVSLVETSGSKGSQNTQYHHNHYTQTDHHVCVECNSILRLLDGWERR